MNEHIIVYHKGTGMHVFREVAEEFGLRDGQCLPNELFWPVLNASAALGIVKCRVKIAQDAVRGER